jgi:hypothetical protein
MTVITACADDLEDLKAASVHYVAAVKAVLAISDDSDCSETIAKANNYAAAKIAYYAAARKAMPNLANAPLQISGIKHAWPSNTQSKTPSNSLGIISGWRALDLCKRSSNQRSSSSTLQRDDPGSLQNYCLFA